MATFEHSNYSDQLNSVGDQLVIATPEQVELQFSVAGIGSRLVAHLLDLLLIGGFILLEVILFAMMAAAAAATGPTAPALDTAGKWFIAIVIFVNFVLFWGYFALFEGLWRGQTPGKRAMKLRVLKDSGRQITFFEALARNLLRFIDYMPSLYLAGVITMLCNKQNKRLGDLAAGTLVVHERTEEQPLLFQSSTTILAPTVIQTAAPWQQSVPALFPADAVARLSAQDLLLIESFFARMLDLPMDTRASMAYRISSQMAAKMLIPLPEGNPERALESMAFQMRSSGSRF